MSIRSYIGILTDDEKVKYVYCHFDGYIGYNGKILLENYKNKEIVNELIELGDLSNIAETIDDPYTYAYHRNRGEEYEGVKPKYFNSENEYWGHHDVFIEYKYLFNIKTNEWWVQDYNKVPKLLTQELINEHS